ncbi:hypothetical protein Tco_0819129 [Tanacetum coccineum]|uniref:Uncharacterized protein n=1 Tax=Tanacetum coccineum TaxID=301880 RepID=A0ABQ5A5N8_9ASTR
MVDEQNPQQPPPQTSPETPPTQQDQPESPGTPIPYDHVPQIDYSLDLINIKPNNEVALLYLEHNNSAYFKVVFDFISKYSIAEADLGKSTLKDLLSQQQGNQKVCEEQEVEIPCDLKGLPGKLEEFQSSISVLTNKFSKLKVVDDLPSHLNKVTKALDRFAHAIQSASQKAGDKSVTSVGQASTHPAEREKYTNQATITQLFQRRFKKDTVKADVAKAKIKKGKEELIDLLGLDMVERIYKEKVKYDKYYLKMLNRGASRKITNCDVLSRGKGPITLKVYMDDGYDEIIQNLKASDLHLEELELNLDKPLGEQDPIIKLNTLVKKKRKNVDDLYNHFRSTKRYKTSVQFVDHQVGTVLNEPSLGPGLNDLARTFSSFLIAEVDKRNMNPNKQTRLIEQLRQ